jgi:hypothetical protein
MAMDVPTNSDTEEPEDTDDTTGVLGFAGRESAKSALEPTILDRVPKKHILYIGFLSGSLSTTLLALLIALIFG